MYVLTNNQLPTYHPFILRFFCRMINTENAPYLNAKLGGKVGGRWGEKPKPGLQINGEQNEKDLRDLEIFNAEKFETKSTMLLPSFSLG